MNPIATGNLESVIDALAEALFFQRPLPASERTAAIRWIVGRQGQPGAYADTFAPTAGDRENGIRLFTGEVVRSNVGIGHLLGEEACRVLAAAPKRDRATQAALDRAVASMTARIDGWERTGAVAGTYCCGTCTVGYWRNLANGLFPRADQRLRDGLAYLAKLRLSDGTWRLFPFFYTSLALTEIGPARASDELRHAAQRWRRILPRLEHSTAPFACRRAELGRRVLALGGN
ncbi:MAG TPA: hypothetical protein VK178_13415 [Opitutaceae bacterium]|nr:hypothetical protein [Opitutaceae bacterium]